MRVKAIANLTWKCDLGGCPYCWLYGPDGTSRGLLATEKDHLSVESWIKGLNRLPAGTGIDFCGGEPTLLGEDLVRIVRSLNRTNYGWALTTNMASDSALMTCANAFSANPSGFIMVNCSFHGYKTELKDFLRRCQELEGLVGMERKKIGISFVVSKYWDYSGDMIAVEKFGYKTQPISYRCVYQDKPTEMVSICDASRRCVCINVDGRVWPCPALMRSKRRDEFCSGHLLGDIDFKYTLDKVCSIHCCELERSDWEIARWDASKKQKKEEAKRDDQTQGAHAQ
jgi:hypothetical protein